jgi:hypothetical protein
MEVCEKYSRPALFFIKTLDLFHLVSTFLRKDGETK